VWLFAALAVAWTWPLVLHLRDSLPGGPGDNYSFVWNLWWMRHVLATPGLEYFHTTYLFYPFGTTIADHPHTALPALVAATILRPASAVTAQNLLLLAYVFGNMASMYALVWTLLSTADAAPAECAESALRGGCRELCGVRRGRRRAAVLAAVLFGLSPYLAVHLLGHFDLMAAWTLPLYALALRQALHRGSGAAAIAAGLALGATAYIAYYYVVYLGFFTIVYALAWVDWLAISPSPRPLTPLTRRLRWLCAAGAIGFAAGAAAIVATGGRSFSAGFGELSVRRPQNALTAMWIFAIGWMALTWRPQLTSERTRPSAWPRAWAAVWRVGVVFAAVSAPLLWQAARLVVRGEYVTPWYGWRSIPHGVDLLAPLFGHPLHPLFHAAPARAYSAIGQDFVEVIGWLGIVPVLLLIATRRAGAAADDLRRWRIVASAFALWSLGPFLTVGGFDTGLKLPAILLRFVPFVANARMPGRAIVGVFMAFAVLLAIQISAATGRLRSPAIQWLLVALVAFEYWDAPIRLTPLDRPAVYQALAAAEPGAVCEVPLGIGDGLSVGVGSQDRRVLFYATQHEHPLVGGYIGRMPADAADRYQRTPIAGTLLALSGGAALPASPDVNVTASPCRYLVVNRATASRALVSYLQLLAASRIAGDATHDLYRIR